MIIKSGAILIIILLVIGCGSQVSTLIEPANNESFIVVGSIILQNNGYTPNTEIYLDGIDVMISSKIQTNGKEKIVDHWVVTDKEGYFFLSNVPPGKYALKAIRTTVGTSRLITIANSLRYSGSEFQIQVKTRIPAGSDYFPDNPVGRVMDLRHNFLLIDFSSKSTMRVQHRKAATVPKAKLVDGQIITRPSVPQYYISKFPESQWVSILKQVTY